MSNQRIPPTFLTIPPFLEKIFHLHPYCQVKGTQSPLYKERVEEGGVKLWPIA